MISQKLFERYYPDDSKSGTVIFYSWLRSHMRSEFIVLNVGAGLSTEDKIKSIKGEVQKVVGVDIDNEVMKNEDLDESIVITNNKLPFADNTFDLAWTDYVLEHIDDPKTFLQEVYRVLKPGTSFFFRTPNKYHYVSFVGSITPYWFHKLVSNKARGLSSDTHEPYPTYYNLNSRETITRYSKIAGFTKIELRFIEAEPSYLVFHFIPFLMGVLYERIVNSSDKLSFVRSNIIGMLKK